MFFICDYIANTLNNKKKKKLPKYITSQCETIDKKLKTQLLDCLIYKIKFSVINFENFKSVLTGFFNNFMQT